MTKFHFLHHVGKDHLEFVHAREDMDEAQREALDKLMKIQTDDDVFDIPTQDHSRRLWDIFKNVAGAAGGSAELVIADLGPAERLMDVIRQKRILPYTYRVSERLTRGSRPSPLKLRDLYEHNGIRSTINLCKEMHHGDLPALDEAGLVAKLKAEHIAIVDNECPTYPQVLRLFEFLSDEDNCPAYIHCEQGVGRTGLMTACYRIAFNSWSSDEALEEAGRFGCSMPDQEKFIGDFYGAMHDAKGDTSVDFRMLGYPKTEESADPPGSKVKRQDCKDPG